MENLLVVISKLILELFIFSVLGWLMEVILKLIACHRFINRGTLIGPYCPIYGWGVVSVTVVMKFLIPDQSSNADVFLVGLVVCGALEYLVSWFLEMKYHARWWDYSTKPMNLNGRIWIGNLILFGLASVIIVKYINPIFFGFVSGLKESTLYLIACLIVVILVSDSIASGILMNILKNEIDTAEADDTEEISKKIRFLLKNRSHFLQRFTEAYPNWQARPTRLTRQLKAARKEMNRANRYFKSELQKAAVYAKTEIKNSNERRKQKFEEEYEKAELERNARLASASDQLKSAREKLKEIQDKLNIHY